MKNFVRIESEKYTLFPRLKPWAIKNVVKIESVHCGTNIHFVISIQSKQYEISISPLVD